MAILQMNRQPPVVWKLMPWTPVGRALVAATRRLEESGSNTANLDAQVILAHVLEVDRAWLFAHHDYKLPPAQTDSYAELVARRAASEPVAYLVGRREFYGLEFRVDDRVLIPRPETEVLVDAVLDHIESRPDPHVRVVDVGAGSGAIALAVAAGCPAARIDAVELSAAALEVAQTNITRLDGREQVRLHQGDLLEPLGEPVDIIAANLPYITTRDYPNLMADVRDYEPRVALEAGPEGLDVIERLLTQAPDHLNPGGVIFLEIGPEQGETVLTLAKNVLPQATHLGIRRDYHGFDRLVVIGL